MRKWYFGSEGEGTGGEVTFNVRPEEVTLYKQAAQNVGITLEDITAVTSSGDPIDFLVGLRSTYHGDHAFFWREVERLQSE